MFQQDHKLPARYSPIYTSTSRRILQASPSPTSFCQSERHHYASIGRNSRNRLQSLTPASRVKCHRQKSPSYTSLQCMRQRPSRQDRRQDAPCRARCSTNSTSSPHQSARYCLAMPVVFPAGSSPLHGGTLGSISGSDSDFFPRLLQHGRRVS
jgi:hypothetical protein